MKTPTLIQNHMFTDLWSHHFKFNMSRQVTTSCCFSPKTHSFITTVPSLHNYTCTHTHGDCKNCAIVPFKGVSRIVPFPPIHTWTLSTPEQSIPVIGSVLLGLFPQQSRVGCFQWHFWSHCNNWQVLENADGKHPPPQMSVRVSTSPQLSVRVLMSPPNVCQGVNVPSKCLSGC